MNPLPDVTAAGPVPLAGPGGRLEYRVADRLELASTGGPGRWDVYVAPDGTPLLRRSRLAFATSTLGYDVGVRHPGARQVAPADRADIMVNSTSTTTGADGSFSWPGMAAADVVPSVLGSRVHVVNTAGPSATTAGTTWPVRRTRSTA